MAAPVGSLSGFLARHRSLVVLTGAGVSTASGIPDYRDRDGVQKVARPIQFRDFMSRDEARRRYWSRSFTGWPRFSVAEPNAAHAALAELESRGKVDTLITQNVDRLHSQAGSRSVIDLHGDLGRVRCMDCEARFDRGEHQARLRSANPAWQAESTAPRPDGDVALDDGDVGRFVVPGCPDCGGILKPDVVMFGENVSRERVHAATAAVERADALLVVGSSLMVFSGFRFARQAHARGIPIAILNLGRTRADGLAALKVESDCAEALARAVAGAETGETAPLPSQNQRGFRRHE